MAHVFISYVREDSKLVESLCNSLRENGVRIWIDRNNIPPGTRWKRSIRKAIDEGDFFIACFSLNYINRGATYMNEELTIAIELLRRMPVDRAWFIPVLLNECEVPDRGIGAGETLLDIQQVRLYEDWDAGITQILSVVKPEDAEKSAEVQSATTDNIISILFLAANPSDTAPLRLDEELREIQSSILQSGLRDRFHVEVRMAVRLADLRRALVQVNPRIVHFAGHGTSSGQLILQDDLGKSTVLSADTLASLFKLVTSKVECVVLNAAYSSEMARTIAQEVNYVIGIDKAIPDRAAITFSSGFYHALANGRSIEEAYKSGCAEFRLLQGDKSFLPVLVMKG